MRRDHLLQSVKAFFDYDECTLELVKVWRYIGDCERVHRYHVRREVCEYPVDDFANIDPNYYLDLCVKSDVWIYDVNDLADLDFEVM